VQRPAKHAVGTSPFSRLLKYLFKQVFNGLTAQPWMAVAAKQARQRLIGPEPVQARTGPAI
jgi:hypothetical protein